MDKTKNKFSVETQRIILPQQRFSAAALVLTALVASAAVFVWMQPDLSDPYRAAPQPSPIAAEAAPIVPAIDPRLDEVAALMPAEAAEPLPNAQVRQPPSKPHAVNLTVKARPQVAPMRARASLQLESLTAQGIAAGRNGDYTAAEQSLRAALALDRTNPVILYNLAVVAEHRGDADSARTLYEATLQHAAERPDTPLRPALIAARLDALDARNTHDDTQESR